MFSPKTTNAGKSVTNERRSFENDNDIFPYLNKYPSLSDLSLDDYSASKPLSYDSDLEREYAMVNRPSSPEHRLHHEHARTSARCDEQLVDDEADEFSVTPQDEETAKSRCTSLFESEKPSSDAINKFSKSFSIAYSKSPKPGKRLSLYQLLGNFFVF